MITKDAYGHDVVGSTDGTTDTYVVGGAYTYTFPAGTSDAAVSLYIAQQQNLIRFNLALTTMVNSHYDSETRLRWVQNWIESTVNLWTQRLAYVNTLVAWGTSVTLYTGSYISTMMALTDPTVVAATVWSFSALEAADPKINLLVYIAKGTL